MLIHFSWDVIIYIPYKFFRGRNVSMKVFYLWVFSKLHMPLLNFQNASQPYWTLLCWSWIKIYFLDSEVTPFKCQNCWIVFKHSYFLIGLNWRRKPHNLLFGNLDGFYEHYYFHTVSVSVCVCLHASISILLCSLIVWPFRCYILWLFLLFM